MASIIKIKRSGTAGNPATLASGEFAYSYLTDNGTNGGDRLYLGTGTESVGNAANHEVVAGRYYTRLIDASSSTGGILTTNAKSIPILSATGTIDKWYVGNVYTSVNTISTTDTDGDLILNPNGTGKVKIANTWTLPRSAGTSDYVLKTDGSNTSTWVEPKIYIGSTAVNLFNTSGTVTSLAVDISGKATTAGTADQVGHSITFNTTGGAAAGTTFDGSAAKTIDYSTVGALSSAASFYIGTTSISVTQATGTITSLAVDISGKATTAGTADQVGHTLSAGTDIDFDAGTTFDGATDRTLNVTSTLSTVVGRGATTTTAITVGGLTINSGTKSYSLPAEDGSSGYYLKTNGSGTLTWEAISAGSDWYLGSTMLGTSSGTVNSVSGFETLSGGNYGGNYVKVGDIGFGPALGTTNSDSDVRIETGASGTVAHTWLFKKDGTTSFNGAYTFPASDGSTGYVLTTDGEGNVSWSATAATQIQSDWTQTDTGALDYIKNKPNLSDVATSGSYNDLLDLPTLATVATSGLYSDLSGTPMLATVATSGLYSDLSGTPMLATVATSGLYSDLSGTPTSITSFGITDGDPGTVLVTDGSGNFSFSSTVSGLTSVTIGDLTIHNDNEIEYTGAAADGDITLTPKGTGHISASNAFIKDVKDPEADQDAATKKYVDGVAQGIHTHDSAKVATGATLADISGGGVSYSDGVAGVGAFITLSTPITMLDGYSLLNGDRILVKNEGDVDGLGDYANGIYTWATGGTTLTRAVDFNTTTEVAGGDFVFVTTGTVFGKTGWVQVNKTTGIGSGHPIDFRQFSGAGTYLAGNGLSITGNTFSVNVATSGGLEIVNDDIQLKSTVAGNGLTYANGVIDVVGTSDRISVTANAIDIASTYAGQNTIVTVGTITGGIWQSNAIGATYGGTAQTSWAKGDLLYASDTNTLAKLAGGSDGQVLQMNSSGLPVWATLDGGTYA